MKLFTRQFHANTDYVIAVALIVLPFLLGLATTEPLAFLLSVVTGFASLFQTAITDHETGVVPLLPYWVHLVVDGLVGLVFLATPVMLGLGGVAAGYFLVMGAVILFVTIAGHPSDHGAEE